MNNHVIMPLTFRRASRQLVDHEAYVYQHINRSLFPLGNPNDVALISLPIDQQATFIHSFINCEVDRCNGMYYPFDRFSILDD
jgi:hypothetical protein